MPGNVSAYTHAIFRIVAGALFLEHGLQKLFGFFGGINGSTVPLVSLLGMAGVLELGGGLLVIAGFLTRPVAAVLVLEMLSAFVIAHLPQGIWPIQNMGEVALLYASVFLFLAGNGAGPLSVDAWLPAFKSLDRRNGMGDRRRPLAA
jgi:putative oxidoreductase